MMTSSGFIWKIMHDFKWNPFYKFDDDYFRRVKKLLLNHSTLVHAYLDNEIIGSMLLLHYASQISCYLIGEKQEHKNKRTSDLLYQMAINYAIENNIITLNLGGGMRFDLKDSLFTFKMKYASFYKAVHIGKKVINHEVFNHLISVWTNQYPHLKGKYRNFFLKYRLNK